MNEIFCRFKNEKIIIIKVYFVSSYRKLSDELEGVSNVVALNCPIASLVDEMERIHQIRFDKIGMRIIIGKP